MMKLVNFVIGFFKFLALVLILFFGIFINPILKWVAKFKPEDNTRYYHRVRKFDAPNECCRKYIYNTFESENIFKEFDKDYSKLFNVISHIKSYEVKPKATFLYYQHTDEFPAHGIIHQCKACNKVWELDWPENAHRGYFKPINLTLEEITPYLQ
ncbi:MAG: hypothetical protein JXR05_11975 [Flavobacteriaceae bacterium]